jgi:hypothetical protein
VKEFRDDQGRPWMVALTVAAAERVRGLVTVDVTEDVDQPDGNLLRQTRQVPFDLIDVSQINRTLEILRTNYGTIGEVLYAVCRQQVEEKHLTKEQFLEGLRGDAIEAGVKALEEELVDFFPQGLRRMVRLLAGKMDELAAELRATAEANLERVTIQSLGLSGTPSTRPQEFSASTPASGPSEISSSQETVGSKWTGGTQPTSSPSRPTSTKQSTRQRQTQPS